MTFRPVALPALAAAVRGASVEETRRKARALAASGRFEHEDMPLA